MIGDKIASCALEYVGTPYIHQGRKKGVGVDCAGLIVCVLQDLGLYQGGDITDYTMNPDGFLLQHTLDKHLKKVNKEELQNGDILLFKFLNNPQHLAFYISDDYMVHSYNDLEYKVIYHRLDSKWLKRLVAVYRVEE